MPKKMVPLHPCGHPSDTGIIQASEQTGIVNCYCLLCMIDAINELHRYKRIKPVWSTTLDELARLKEEGQQ